MRFDRVLQGADVAAVLHAAQWLRRVDELRFQDMAHVCAFLVEHDENTGRASRARARLVARLTLALDLDLESLDGLCLHVDGLPEPDAMAGLLGFCRSADRAPSADAR